MPDLLENEVAKEDQQEEIRDEVVEQEDTQEVAEPEQEEVAQEVEETPDWRDDQIKSIAQQAGWNEATLDSLGSKEAFWAAVTAASQWAQQNQFGGEQTPAKESETSESASPEFPELDLSDLDDDDPSRAKFQQFRDAIVEQLKARDQKIQALEQQHSGWTQMQQQQQEVARQQWFDGAIKGVNPDVFGSESIAKCNQAQAQARIDAYQRFQSVLQALPHESPETIFQMVTANTKKNTPSKLTQKRAAQIQGGRPPQQQPEDRKDAYEKVNRAILGTD